MVLVDYCVCVEYNYVSINMCAGYIHPQVFLESVLEVTCLHKYHSVVFLKKNKTVSMYLKVMLYVYFYN